MRFGGQVAVEGVSLSLGPGDIVGLVGANGGGKTTTLRMIAGLLRPTGGCGQVLGCDVTRPARDKARIGYMTQTLALYPELSVRENLMFRANIGADRRASIREIAARHGLDRVVDQRVGTLSGGWARRVQFAASVLHGPDLLLLDEPTAGLDSITRRDMWAWIEVLAAEGRAILVSTHDLGEAERCPAILHFRGGVAEGPLSPRALMDRFAARTLEEAIMAGAKS